jgi:hypothetical protein
MEQPICHLSSVSPTIIVRARCRLFNLYCQWSIDTRVNWRIGQTSLLSIMKPSSPCRPGFRPDSRSGYCKHSSLLKSSYIADRQASAAESCSSTQSPCGAEEPLHQRNLLPSYCLFYFETTIQLDQDCIRSNIPILPYQVPCLRCRLGFRRRLDGFSRSIPKSNCKS